MTRSPRGLRIPMFVKFVIGCFALASLLIIGGTFVVKSEARLRNRGAYLQKDLRRFHGYEQLRGKAMTGALEMLASDPALRRALIQTGPAAVPVPGGDTPSEIRTAGDGQRTAAAIAEEMAAKLSSKNSIEPDLFAVYTARGELVWAAPGMPVRPGDLAELAPVEKLRAGVAFEHKPVLIDRTLYQVSALPVINPGDDRVLGILVAGVAMQDYVDDFAKQSDVDPDRMIRPLFVSGQEVLAAAYPPDQWPELGRAVQPDRVVRVQVGDDVRDVVRTRAGDLDFFSEPLEGWKDGDRTDLGKVFVLRGRASVVDPGSKIPWTEIAVGGVLSVIIASLMALWITRPIKQFVVQSRALLEGGADLTQRIIVNSRDETADLAENINQVFARLEQLASEVQAAAFQVGASSAEISAASKQMLAGLKDQTLKIEGSTAAVTELSASIQTVAGNAAQATGVAERSNVAVTSAVQRMQQIRGSVEEAAERMRELGESSKRIGNIVEVIRQISEQTSLLALNASIEAAHAGEQGRGFAVVADEVSSLARRVGQSAKDIEALIQTIKEQTSAAMSSMDVGTREVENGTQLVTHTLTDLGQLISVVKDTAHAVQEQAVVSDEIARNMDAVQRIAGEVLTGSEESVTQAERLHELAFGLEESIGGFNLEGSRLDAGRGNGVDAGRDGGGRPGAGNGRPKPGRAIAATRRPALTRGRSADRDRG
jgi:methyl-accepting chemotaxis protein